VAHRAHIAAAGTRAAPPALRAASSLWLGLGLLAAIFIYLAVASVWPPPPGKPPGTPSVLYGLWPLKLLIGLLAANVILANIVRVPTGWAHLGAWLGHAGLILLLCGAAVYVEGHVSGAAVAVRDDDGAFGPVERYFLEDTAAMYVGPDRAGAELLQTPLTDRLAAGADRPLQARVASPFDAVTFVARDYLPSAELRCRWRDDGPADVPAARIRLRDGPHVFRRVLCPSCPFAREFNVGAYVVRFVPPGAGKPPEWLIVKDRPEQDLAVVGRTADGGVSVLVIGGDGRRSEHAAEVGRRLVLTLGGRPVELTVEEFLTRAWRVWSAYAAPDGSRPAAVKLRAAVGEWVGWQWVRWEAFVGPAVRTDPAAQRLPLPDGQWARLHFAPESRPLPVPFRIAQAEYVTYPGSTRARDYVCRLTTSATATAKERTLICRLNRPAVIDGLRVYQGSWSPKPEDPRAISFMVSSRPGIGLVGTGALLIVLALPYAFYVKPLLLRRGKGTRR